MHVKTLVAIPIHCYIFQATLYLFVSGYIFVLRIGAIRIFSIVFLNILRNQEIIPTNIIFLLTREV